MHKVRGVAVYAVVVAAGGDLIVPHPGAHQLWQCGISDGKGIVATVRFDNRDGEVAAAIDGADIANLKGPRRNVLGEDDVLVLADFNPGVAIGYAPDDRRVAGLAAGQHFAIATKLRATKLDAVKDARVGAGLADFQAATPRNNAGLEGAGKTFPAIGLVAGFIPVGAIAQAPGAKIEPAV